MHQVAPPVRTSRGDWIRAGLTALAAGGPDSVRIEGLAKSLGVTKGGFYGYFSGREEFLSAMLEDWEQTMVDQVINQIEHDGGDSRARLAHLYSLADDARDLLDVELAIRQWARRDASVAARLEHVDTRRINYLRALFSEFCDPAEVEARCQTAIALFVARPLVHGNLAAAASRLLT